MAPALESGPNPATNRPFPVFTQSPSGCYGRSFRSAKYGPMGKPESSISEPRQSGSRRRAVAWFLAKWSMVGAIWTGFFALLFLAWCAFDLPGPERLNELKRQPSVALLAADGSLIASYGDLYGDSVRLAD